MNKFSVGCDLPCKPPVTTFENGLVIAGKTSLALLKIMFIIFQISDKVHNPSYNAIEEPPADHHVGMEASVSLLWGHCVHWEAEPQLLQDAPGSRAQCAATWGWSSQLDSLTTKCGGKCGLDSFCSSKHHEYEGWDYLFNNLK